MKTIIFTIFLLAAIAKSQIFISELGRFGGEGTEPAMFNNPSAIDISGDGKIFVCDRGNHRIQVFNLRGEFIKDAGGFGWGNEQFDNPADIWARSTLNVYVADYNNMRIQRFDKDLNYIGSRYSNEGDNERFQFKEILSVAYSPQGDIFVLDAGENKVIKYTAKNQGEVTFGYYESGEGKLISPVQIDLTPNHRALVSDCEKNGVLVYDYFGAYLFTIKHQDFKCPSGITVDNAGRIYVADIEDRSIYIFSGDGKILMNFNNINGLLLKRPVDMAVFRNKGNDYNLYVIDGNQVIIAHLQFKNPEE